MTEEEILQWYVAEIAMQLTQSERFQRFFKVNYEVKLNKDDDANTVDIEIVERSPEAANAALQQMLMEHAAKNDSSVVPASMDDLRLITGNNNDKD